MTLLCHLLLDPSFLGATRAPINVTQNDTWSPYIHRIWHVEVIATVSFYHLFIYLLMKYLSLAIVSVMVSFYWRVFHRNLNYANFVVLSSNLYYFDRYSFLHETTVSLLCHVKNYSHIALCIITGKRHLRIIWVGIGRPQRNGTSNKGENNVPHRRQKLHIINPLLRLWHIRADSRLTSNQRETSLQSNAVSHWPGANLESGLQMCLPLMYQYIANYILHHDFTV